MAVEACLFDLDGVIRHWTLDATRRAEDLAGLSRGALLDIAFTVPEFSRVSWGGTPSRTGSARSSASWPRRAARPGLRCFFTDDLEPNVTGALAVGMRAEQFTDVTTLRETLRGLGLPTSA